MYRVIKRYGHEQGLSCVFRQWRADSHCATLHGYAMAFEIGFEAKELDKNGWVIDFGSLKPVKEWLASKFDHTLLVADDDPLAGELSRLEMVGVAKVIHVEQTGCEAFARFVHRHVSQFLVDSGQGVRVRCYSVKCSEHAGNTAEYAP